MESTDATNLSRSSSLFMYEDVTETTRQPFENTHE